MIELENLEKITFEDKKGDYPMISDGERKHDRKNTGAKLSNIEIKYLPASIT